MYSKSIASLFSKSSLTAAAKSYASHSAYEALQTVINTGVLRQSLLQGSYVPNVTKSFLLPKRDGSTRPIAVGDLADRVVQKVIATALQDDFDFSDKSYAYRPNKGPVKAIHRLLDFIGRGYFWMAKTDISSFFESIDQTILSQQLHEHIKDEYLLSLIMMYYKNGVLNHNEYFDHTLGIHQGDPLSPLLSNIYLDPYDRYLESENIQFVRFGDDMILLAHDKQTAFKYLEKARLMLSTLHLELKDKKTSIQNISEGVSFLGVYIRNHSVRIEKSRLEDKIAYLHQKSKKLDIYESIKAFNEHIDGFKAYYSKVITDSRQLDMFHQAVNDILKAKIVLAKEKNIITRQSEFKAILSSLKSYQNLDAQALKQYQNSIIASAYALLNSNTPEQNASKKIEQKKQKIIKNQFHSSELILAKIGVFLGFSRGKAILKERGKIIKSMPINQLSRVIILSQASLSSEIIYQCAKRGIDIDFIRKNEPYAMLSFNHQPHHAVVQKQYKDYESNRFLAISKNMLAAKIKNQVNLIKYFARYRKSADNALYQQLFEIAQEIVLIAKKLSYQKSKDIVRGIEGSCSSLYWRAFGLLIGEETFHRTTRDAPDAINQALNYGYGILYHRVQSSLLKAHLDIYAPLFHAPQAKKPTLVYDAIEEFRQAVVDREVIALLNRNQKITVSQNHLSIQSVKIVTQHVQNRLSGQTMYKKEKHRLESVINQQALLLAKAIEGSTKYHAFVVHY